jgi:Zn-dependent protease
MRKWLRVRQVRIFDAPLYVHWSVLLITALLASLSFLVGFWFAITAAVCYFALILLHEAGHAFVAHRLGYEVEAIRLSGWHGRCEFEAPETEEHHVMIVWGGVLAQLALALPMVALMMLAGRENLGYAGGLAVTILGRTNLIIAAINLLPVPGLDGAIAWRIIPLGIQWWNARRVAKRALSKFTRRS